jgi:hypothetical protein
VASDRHSDRQKGAGTLRFQCMLPFDRAVPTRAASQKEDYNPSGDRQIVYINDPDYAQYRLKKVFNENWTAVK